MQYCPAIPWNLLLEWLLGCLVWKVWHGTGSLCLVKQTHGLTIWFSFALDVLDSSPLTDVYMKNGLVVDAWGLSMDCHPSGIWSILCASSLYSLPTHLHSQLLTLLRPFSIYGMEGLISIDAWNGLFIAFMTGKASDTICILSQDLTRFTTHHCRSLW